MRLQVLIAAAGLACAACGSPSTRSAGASAGEGGASSSEGGEGEDGEDGEGGEDEDGEEASERRRVAMRLGCDVLSRRQLRREARRFPADAPMSQRERAVIREHVIRALAEWYDIEVTDDEVDRTLVMIREQNGLSESDFEDALEEQGLEVDEYREQLRDQIMMTKVVTTGLSRLGGIAPDEIGEPDVRRFLREAQDRLEDVPTEGRGRRCREQWPAVSVAEIRFEGLEGVDRDELVEVAESEADEGVLHIGPDGRFPAAVEDAWRSVFFERGYLGVRFELPEPDEEGEGALVILEQGPRYRLGEARVRFVRRTGAPIEDPELDRLATQWAGELERAEDGFFRRSDVGEWAQSVEAHVRETWGEHAAILPQVDVGDEDEGEADVGLMIVLADDISPPSADGRAGGAAEAEEAEDEEEEEDEDED